MPGNPIQLSRSNVREANLGDLPALERIDAACFEYQWAASDFKDALASRGATVTLVVEHQGQLIAFMLYTRAPRKRTAQIMRLAVMAEFRKRTIGAQLVAWLHRELDAATKLSVCVQENDKDAQLFFRQINFSCVRTRPKYYTFGDGATADAYEFVFGAASASKILKAPRGPLTVDLKNRVRRYMRDDDGQCESDL